MSFPSSLGLSVLLGIGIAGCETRTVSNPGADDSGSGTSSSTGGTGTGGSNGQGGSTAMGGASGETANDGSSSDPGRASVGSGGDDAAAGTSASGGAGGSGTSGGAGGSGTSGGAGGSGTSGGAGGSGASGGAASGSGGDGTGGVGGTIAGGTASGGSGGSSPTGGATGGTGPTCASTDTLDHCGACDDPCDTSHASMRCVAGDCVIDACSDGYCNLDGIPRNGCEAPVNLYSDPENCGACGHVCSSGVCTGGNCQTRAFVTSDTYQGNLGGLSGADQKCQNLADAEDLGGTWMAWLSTDAVSVAARLGRSPGPVARMDGAIIANDWADLTDGMLAYTLTVNEFGEEISAANYSAWTNTNADGSSYGINDCTDWTTSSFDIVAVQGSSDYVDDRWSVLSTSIECGLDARLYCFEQ